MYRNKRLEIVLILSLIILLFFCMRSINEKLSQKNIYKNLANYIDSKNHIISLEDKLTYNDKLYILYSAKNQTSETIGYIEFEKNFLGWWSANKTNNTRGNYSSSVIDSVLKNKAILIYGKNSSEKPYNLKIETPIKTFEKDILQRRYFLYIEEIDCNSSEIKLSSK